MHIRMDERCRWPDLPECYASALRDAVSFVLDRFNVVGVVACEAETAFALTIGRGLIHGSELI